MVIGGFKHQSISYLSLMWHNRWLDGRSLVRFCKEAQSMAKKDNKSVWILVVVIAVVLQVLFVFADYNKSSATGTAVAFSKAYFMLDDDLEKFVCSDLIGEEDESAVATYLHNRNQEARKRGFGGQGFGKGMVRQMIYHVKTETLAQDEASATIHIHGLRRTNIHPAFTFVAKLFQLGHVREFEETLDLTRKDGEWKVCGSPYGLSLEG
jgi:hypothetical protein